MSFAGNRWMRLAQPALLSALAMLGVFYVSPAKADFRVCNATQGLVGVAIGYRTAEGWKSEGWWQIEKSSCTTIIEGALSSRFYYLYAEDADRGGRWGGPINMCVLGDAFEISGVNDCFARGFQRAGFKEYDTGEQSSWMVQLTEDASNADEPGPTPSDAPPAPGQ